MLMYRTIYTNGAEIIVCIINFQKLMQTLIMRKGGSSSLIWDGCAVENILKSWKRERRLIYQIYSKIRL